MSCGKMSGAGAWVIHDSGFTDLEVGSKQKQPPNFLGVITFSSRIAWLEGRSASAYLRDRGVVE